jgi:hypothetical protein
MKVISVLKFHEIKMVIKMGNSTSGKTAGLHDLSEYLSRLGRRKSSK